MLPKLSINLLLTLLLLAAGCSDDEPEQAPVAQLPPATQSGRYTFGCLVNGEVWVPDNTNSISSFYQQNVLFISAGVEGNRREQDIGFVFENQVIKEQSYELTPSIFKGGHFIDSNNNCYYDFEDLVKGTLVITHFDDVEHIISGTFEFTTATEGCDTIRVTDGRFDIPYIP